MAYTKISWKDYPDTSTPMNATNLNKMDDQIAANASDLEDAIYYEEAGDTTDYVNLIADQANKDGAGNNIAQQFSTLSNNLTDKTTWKKLGDIVGASLTIPSTCKEILLVLMDSANNVWASDTIPYPLLGNIGSYYHLCGSYYNHENSSTYSLVCILSYANGNLIYVGEYHSRCSYGKVSVYYR